MAGQLIDTDPELAYAHAEAARRRAARLPVTREATGETAYAAGHYAIALNEFRALRRMSGTNEYLPAMADCERALGRAQAALRLVKEGLAADPDVTQLVELRLVEAGVRVDAGQADEALRLLRAELERIGPRGSKLARARLRFAYADLLETSGELELAERWFEAAAALDVEQATDAAERAEALQGVTIVFDDSEDEADDAAEDDAEPAEDGAEFVDDDAGLTEDEAELVEDEAQVVESEAEPAEADAELGEDEAGLVDDDLVEYEVALIEAEPGLDEAEQADDDAGQAEDEAELVDDEAEPIDDAEVEDSAASESDRAEGRSND